jgi:hypothetical protein
MAVEYSAGVAGLECIELREVVPESGSYGEIGDQLLPGRQAGSDARSRAEENHEPVSCRESRSKPTSTSVLGAAAATAVKQFPPFETVSKYGAPANPLISAPHPSPEKFGSPESPV